MTRRLRLSLTRQVNGPGGARKGHAASTIHNVVIPIKALFRREIEQGRLAVNPTSGLKLPCVHLTRDRIADPTEAAKLLAALPVSAQPLWATALFGGLRHGELRALRWEDVDLATGIIRVERSWDHYEGYVTPKSDRGTRKVPVPAILRDYLVEHRMREGRSEGVVFGKTATIPFHSGAMTRADKAWKAAGLRRITLHEARHTFASYAIAAGVNVKALSTYMGHANISITLDRYGHLMPGNEEEAAGLLDAYLERANTQARPR